MKRALKIILPLFFVTLILTGALWFFLVFRRDETADFCLQRADRAMAYEEYDRAIRLYNAAEYLSGQNAEIRIRISEAYAAAGNFTRAEYALVGAITEDSGNLDLYAALSSIYVRQGKLLDAEQMLSRISNEEVLAQMDALRPAPPEFSEPSGVYNTYIELSLTVPEGTAYWNTSGSYPCVDERYTAPITLPNGPTEIIALSVAENGLVSRAVFGSYTIGRVVETAEFADPVLEDWVRYVLDLHEDVPLTTDKLWTIQALYLPEGITTLEDLRYFEDLSVLSVQDLSGVSFQPVTALKKLRYLNLDGCPLTSDDLQAIGTLTTLTELHLANCGISNIHALSALTALQTLDLTGNSIVSIEPIGGMTQMLSLHLGQNAVADVSCLASLTALEILDLSNNVLADDSILDALRSMRELYLAACGVEDLTFLSGMQSLQKLDLSANALTDLTPLSGCSELIWLNVSNNQITTLDPIANLLKLGELFADYNQITDLPAFSEECRLFRLTISYNQLTDAAGACMLPNLNYLVLDYNALEDISYLALCQNLIEVDAFGNPIPDVQALLDCSIIVNYDPTWILDHPIEEDEEADDDNGAETGE